MYQKSQSLQFIKMNKRKVKICHKVIQGNRPNTVEYACVSWRTDFKIKNVILVS